MRVDEWMGRRVTVTIDRPLGSKHPSFPDGETYPLNYGYVAGTTAGDGEPIDAYILGIDEPLQSFEGPVVAVIIRRDDAEGKLVVAPHGSSFERSEIEDAVEFQERYFDSEVVTE